MISTVDPTLHYLLVTAGVLLLVAAALHDVAARTVPDLCALLLAGAGIVARVADAHLMTGLLAGTAVFVAATICWMRGWVGGGDVKLLGAAALLVPPAAAGIFVLDVALAGGLLALTYILLRNVVPSPVVTGRRPRSLLARALRAERWRIHRNCPLPYASAIAAGALFCIFHG